MTHLPGAPVPRRFDLDRLLPPQLRTAEPATLLRARLLLLYSAVTLTVPVIVGFLYLQDGAPEVALAIVGGGAFGASTMAVMWWTRSMLVTGNFAAATFAGTNTLALLLMGCKDLASFYWIGAAPIFATFLSGARSGAVWLGLTSCLQLALIFVRESGWLSDRPNPTSALNDMVGVWTLSAVLLLLAIIYERSKDRMLAQLQQTAAELELARQRAEAATNARTAFLAHMSHEIRTPMNGILGMADLMRDQPLPDDARKYADVILDSGRALVSIIDDILDFAKADAGRLTLSERPCDVRAVLEAAATLLAERARTRDLQLRLAVDETVPPLVRTDPGRLRQVALNLLSNAIKFTERGAVLITARWHGDRLHVEVSDTGIGIAPDATSHLFMPFRQLDDGSARQYGGTGLGLVICRQIVEAMGGSIGVRSELGHGSTFWFDVIAMREVASPPLAKAAVTRPMPRSTERHILVVEDNAVNRMVARRMVERQGHRVREVDSGEAAVALAATEHFDLVLMDCQMPGMDGFAATRAIRQLPGLAGAVPIVALTASALTEDRNRCREAGMDGYLTKPLDDKSLAAEILLRIPDGPQG